MFKRLGMFDRSLGMFQPSRFTGSVFTPAALFAAGEQGVWYDPSDFSTMFQDSAGTTPVTAVEQPVGLLLDKSKGLVLGSELSSNPGNPFTSTTGYVAASSTLSVVSGRLKASIPSASTGTSGVYWDTSVTASKSQKLVFNVEAEVRTFTVTVYDGASFSTPLATTNFAPGSPTTVSFIVRPTSSAIRVYIYEGSGVDRAVYLSAISVKELPGNHASQPTTTARPILRNLYNLLTYTEQFDNADWVKTQSSISATNSTTAPDGTVTADTYLQAGSSSAIYYTQTTRPAGTYTTVIHIKKITGSYFKLGMLEYSGASYVGVGVDLDTGQLGTPYQLGWSYVSASATDVGNGWWKLTLTGTITAGTCLPYFFMSTTLGFGSPRLTDGSFYIWGASLVPANEASLPYQRVVTNTLGSGVYDTDLSKFKPYLAFDGTDDFLVTGNINFSATDKMSAFAGVSKLSTSTGAIFELSANVNANTNAFNAFANSTATNDYAFWSRGNAVSSLTQTAIALPYAAPITNVLYVTGDISGNLSYIRINNTAEFSATGNQGAGNYGPAYPLYIGRRGGTTLPLTGRIYSLIVRGALTSGTQLTNTETWVNGKTGAY